MAYLDDWIAAMTVPGESDPQEAAKFQKSVRGPTLRDLLGAQDSFQIMGPNGQVDQAATDELLNRPDRGPALKTENYSVYTPSGSLNAETLRSLSQMRAANPLMDKSPEERKRLRAEADTINEQALYQSALRGDPTARAEMNRRKAINDANQLNFKTLVDLAKGDPETAAALMERMTGIPRGPSQKKPSQMTNEADRIAGSMVNPATGETYTGYEDPALTGPQREKILKDVEERSTRMFTARAEAAPLAASTQRDLGILGGVLRQADIIGANLNDEYLGPIKGTQTAFKARRQIGTSIGTPLGEKEVTFRTALQDVSDMLLRARSGAQINEAEYQRMIEILPKATDEPGVFRPAMRRFRTEMGALIKDKERLGKMSRGTVGTGETSKSLSDMSDEELLEALK